MADLTACLTGAAPPSHIHAREKVGVGSAGWQDAGSKRPSTRADHMPRYLGTQKLLILSPPVKSVGGDQSFRSSSTLARLAVMLSFSRSTHCSAMPRSYEVSSIFMTEWLFLVACLGAT